MAWVKLTAPNGNIVQISADQVVRVRPPVLGETDDQGHALVDLSNGQSQATRETVDEIMSQLAPDKQ
jgi:hypothetical protein